MPDPRSNPVPTRLPDPSERGDGAEPFIIREHVPVALRHGDVLPDVPGYAIESVLGRGGMAVVYKARQVAANRPVALKIILGGDMASEAERDRLRTEAEAIARLNHPNIVQIYEVGEYRGLPFFSLEYCAGGSLAQYLAGKPMTAASAARLVACLAGAVGYAHQAGVIHRDLKPANILLSRADAAGLHPESGRRGSSAVAEGNSSAEVELLPKVTDFGLAKHLDAGPGQTRSGQVMGTPSYMAPEQALGETRHVGPTADVYALGAILYECLTGRPPFRAATTLETLDQVRHKEPVSVRALAPTVPADLETICLKCLQKDPHRRYALADDLADDLRRFLAGRPIVARPVGLIERIVKWVRRNSLSTIIAAGFLLSSSGAALAAVVAIQIVQDLSAINPDYRLPPAAGAVGVLYICGWSLMALALIALLTRADAAYEHQPTQSRRKDVAQENPVPPQAPAMESGWGPPNAEQARRGLLATLRASLGITVASALIGGGHLAFGHPATGVGFLLLAVIGVTTSTFLRSVWKSRLS
jgi:serine/threonine protein kinase